MLGDVEVDWDLPAGYGIRASRSVDGHPDDILVCIPLPGDRRYRMSMATPPELSRTAGQDGDGIAHGLSGEHGPVPGIEHIQEVLDRLSPAPRPPPRCAGPRCSASATASSTGTAADGSSWPGTPRTSTRPRVPRG